MTGVFNLPIDESGIPRSDLEIYRMTHIEAGVLSVAGLNLTIPPKFDEATTKRSREMVS